MVFRLCYSDYLIAVFTFYTAALASICSICLYIDFCRRLSYAVFKEERPLLFDIFGGDLVELDRLADFAAVAKNGSIKKAAEELGCSSATLSARIQSFERSLGAELFTMRGKLLVMTEAGERLLPSAMEILGGYQRLMQTLRAAEEHSYQSLRIAVTGSNLPLHLGPFLDQLNLRYPEMHLELLDDTTWSVEEGLRSGAVDIYFAPVMADFSVTGMTREIITSSNQYVVMPRSHKLAGRNSISLRELDGECFIPYPETMETCIRDFTLRNLAASGMRYTIYADTISPQFYKLLIPIGKGLILLPMPIMDLPPNTVLLTVSDLKYPATPCFFYDASSKNSEVHAFVRDFKAFIKEVSRHDHTPAL